MVFDFPKSNFWALKCRRDETIKSLCENDCDGIFVFREFKFTMKIAWMCLTLLLQARSTVIDKARDRVGRKARPNYLRISKFKSSNSKKFRTGPTHKTLENVGNFGRIRINLRQECENLLTKVRVYGTFRIITGNISKSKISNLHCDLSDCAQHFETWNFRPYRPIYVIAPNTQNPEFCTFGRKPIPIFLARHLEQ